MTSSIGRLATVTKYSLQQPDYPPRDPIQPLDSEFGSGFELLSQIRCVQYELIPSQWDVKSTSTISDHEWSSRAGAALLQILALDGTEACISRIDRVAFVNLRIRITPLRCQHSLAGKAEKRCRNALYSCLEMEVQDEGMELTLVDRSSTSRL